MNKDGIYMKENQFKNLPFPYFYLDQNMEIVATSLAKNAYEGLNFTHLLDEFSLKPLQQFLCDSSDHGSKIFYLMLPPGESLPHRLYKMRDHDGFYHIFCHPIESGNELTFKQLRNMKDTLADKNIQLSRQNQNYEDLKKEFNEILTKSDHLATVSKLAAGIAHEIRNPLTTIKGFLQLLKPYMAQINKEEYATVALEEIDRANEIIYSFLNMAKPKMVEKDLKATKINQLIQEIKLLYESEAILRNVTIETSLAPSNPVVSINENQLKQVLINMIKNAMEAIEHHQKKEGTIHLWTEESDGKGIIQISDNGCGMDPESIERLFTPFFTTKPTGTGLGLSICKKIINEHGGQIHINSEPGKGTTFRVELPICKISILHA